MPAPAASNIAYCASSPSAISASPTCRIERPSLCIIAPPKPEPRIAPNAHGAIVSAAPIGE